MAQLLGPPFTPGSTRRQLAFFAALLAIVAASVAAALKGQLQTFPVLARAAVGGMLPALCASGIFAIDVSFSQRLATLFRRNRPELAELALLPGLGSQRQRALAFVIAWRSLQAYGGFVFAAVLVLAWLSPAQWPLPLAGLAALALLWLDAARRFRSGRGLLPNTGIALMARLATSLAFAFGLLATNDPLVRLGVLLVLAAMLIFAAMQLRAAASAADAATAA